MEGMMDAYPVPRNVQGDDDVRDRQAATTHQKG